MSNTVSAPASDEHGWIKDPTPVTDEIDPNGLDQHSPGAKLDAGKPRMSLVLKSFARAIWKVCEVGTYGAIKYSADGWLQVENGEERYNDAELRHMFTRFMGEDLDPDTELEHLAHEAWNALAQLELALRKKDEQQA